MIGTSAALTREQLLAAILLPPASRGAYLHAAPFAPWLPALAGSRFAEARAVLDWARGEG